MAKQQWTAKTVPPAFDKTLKAAITTPDLKRKLLDPDTAKVKKEFSDFADIEVPANMTIRFYPEEELPHNIAMAIPAAKGNTTEVPGPPRKPTFSDCFLGFYNTYLQLNDYILLSQVFASRELR
jgi:hypothetical protein